VYAIFENYLDKTYLILLSVLEETGFKEGIGKSNILFFFKKSFIIQTSEEVIQTLERERKKMIAKINDEFEKDLQNMDDDDSFSSSSKSDTSDFNEEREIMRAIENGYGDLYGLG
jgi:hypothetical protein